MWIDSCMLTSLAGHLFRVRINQWVQVAKKSVLVFLKRFSTCIDISLRLFWQIQERHCMAWLKSNTIGNCAKCALLFSSSVVLFITGGRKRWNMRQHFNVFFFSDWLLDTFILVIWETNVSIHFCDPLLFTWHSSSKKRKEEFITFTDFFLSLSVYTGEMLLPPPLSPTGDGESDGE